jgi:hypothetical protein
MKPFEAGMAHAVEASAVFKVDVGITRVIVCQEVADADVEVGHMVGMHEDDVLQEKRERGLT